MKQSTFSAVMANSIKNLLQGYTKGIRFVAVLILLLTMGIGQASAAYYILGPDGSWDQNATHQMVSSGITNWVYKNLKPSGQWTSFKVYDKDGNKWYGKNTKGEDVTVGAEYTPTTSGGDNYCDFTTNFNNMSYYFFFNTSTKKLMVQPNYYLVGTCGASNQNWGQTQNATTYDATKGYFKWNTCTLTANTEYKFKLSGYGAWTYKYEDWNGVTIVNGTKLTTDNDKNIRFKSTYAGTTVITFNPVTNEMVINCPSQISYNKGADGTGTISSGIKTYGINFTLSSSTFTRTGYTQDGWSTTDGGNKVYDLGGTYTTDKSITLYPHWKPNTYAVQFNANGGTGTMQNQSFTYDAAKNLTANAFSKTGYTFAGWNTMADGSGTKYDDKASVKNLSSTNGATVTLYAQWKEQTFHLAGFMNGWNTSSNPMTISDGKATCTLTLAKGLYDFKIVESGETWRTASTTPRTINRNSNNLEFKTKGGNDNNTSITADVEGTADYVFNYDIANEKLTVTYPAAYTVTYGVGNTKGTTSVITSPSITSGSLVLPSTSITFSKGETKAGYQWKNWNSKADGSGTDLGAGDTYVSSNREADITVYACYDLITYNITYNLNGGSGTISPTTYNVESATITLPTDLTKTGHTFAGWYDNESFSGTAVTQITNGSTGDKTLYAKWTLNTYTVKWYVNGEELPGAATTVAHGSKITTIPEVDLNTYCEGSDVLAGWIAAPMENASVAAPANLYKTIEDFPTVEGPQTFHAVFANYKE